MNAAIGRAALAPVLEQPREGAASCGQLPLGETGTVLGREEAWVRLRLAEDGGEGWVHEGFLIATTEGEAAAWRNRAAWSDGALVQVGAERWWLPLRARVGLASGELELPDGRSAVVVAGSVRPLARVHQEARRVPPEEWARATFAGAPWLRGGVTPGGVDAGGLVQTTWLARGIRLPRHPAAQAGVGSEVPRSAMRAGDLLCFRDERTTAITHVALAAADATLVHASLAAGGVAVESWLPGAPAAALMARLAVVRRLSDADLSRAA